MYGHWNIVRHISISLGSIFYKVHFVLSHGRKSDETRSVLALS